MKKNIISSIMAQLLLLVFVVVWILPTFGLFVSSFRDKDLLAISGWWTSLITTQVNEIHRTEKMDAQVQESDFYIIKSNIFKINHGKKITSFGITSKNINEFLVEETATLKDGSKITIYENGDYKWESKDPFKILGNKHPYAARTLCAVISGNNLPMLTIIFASTPVNSLGKTICSGTFENEEWSKLLYQCTLNKLSG